jgi:hypothetical protein
VPTPVAPANFPAAFSLKYLDELYAEKNLLKRFCFIISGGPGDCRNPSVETMPVFPAPTPVPVLTGSLPASGTKAPDDKVITPGGYAYRANVHAQGVTSGLPSILLR